MLRALDFPPPDSTAQAHSEKLQQLIRDEINEHGPITFERFMEMALYYPGFGYYSAGAQKLGADGDFITAPEISPLFSRCIARQCQQVLKNMSGDILELGAGTGTMGKEILLELESLQTLPTHYFILEISADLKQRQQIFLQQELPHLFNRIIWLNHLPEKPFTGVILANEVLDAMPVHKFKIQNTLKEYYVNYQNQQFTWHLDQPSDTLKKYFSDLNLTFAADYESEINTHLPSWLASISAVLQKGLLLIMDYGFSRAEYYHEQRNSGTLMCHYRHRAHDNPLIFIGLQDITAHVDFTTAIESAGKLDMELLGYTNQANFLMNCGIIDLAKKTEDPIAQFKVSQQLKRLLFPSEMGELFKVMALTKNFAEPLLGFT